MICKVLACLAYTVECLSSEERWKIQVEKGLTLAFLKNCIKTLFVHDMPVYLLIQIGVCVVCAGVIAARDALLTFMVGGTKFDEAKKVLENMGKNIIHCGPVGTGQVCLYY